MHAEGLPADVTLPEGAEVLDASGWRGTGNVLLVVGEGASRAVLKIYRVRRSAGRELLRGFSHRVLEGRRGASARARRETEALGLALWLREGFPVVQPLERPTPPELARHPVLWLEYIEAPTLQELLADPDTPAARKRALVRQLAAETAPRHARAEALNDPLLIQEHASMKHVFAKAGRLITFDLENGFRPGFSLIEAMAQETADTLRSLDRVAGELVPVWVAAYADPARLQRMAQHAVEGKGWRRRAKRRRDRKRGPDSKTALMRRVLEQLRGDASVRQP